MKKSDPLVKRLLETLPSDGQRSGSFESIEDQWEEPVPLPNTRERVRFCLDIFDSKTAEFVEAVAAATGTPPDLPAMAVLGTISAVIAGAVVVEARSGWLEPVNIYTNTVAAPGEGKTPVLEKIARPLDTVERERRDLLEPMRIEAESRLRVAELRRKRLEDVAARATGDDLAVAKDDASEAARVAAEIIVPAIPRVYTRETTPEGCVRILSEQNGRIAIITDEGSEFFQLTARYSSNGKGNLGIFLDGHDGKRHVSDRAGRETISIDRVTLTVCLFSQPIVLSDLARDPQMAGRGLTARFLWSLPPTMVGYRSTFRDAVPDVVIDYWNDLVLEIARQAYSQKSPFVLRLDQAGSHLFDQWWESHEPRLRQDGDLSSIVEWASKLPGQVLRLAGNLHAIRTGSITGSIDEVTMKAALGLADYFTDHALATFSKMRSDPTLDDAILALRWIQRHDSPIFTGREMARSKSWSAKRVHSALALLCEYGWARSLTNESSVGRPLERWERHPILTRQNLTETRTETDLSASVRAC